MSRLKIENFKIEEGQCFVIDTNILFYMFNPMGNPPTLVEDRYIELIEKIKKSNKIKLVSHVFSEFVNLYLRKKFFLLKQKNKNIKDYKKDYRNKSQYRSDLKALLTLMEDFLDNAVEFENDLFEKFKRSDLFRGLDLTDIILKDLCLNKNYILISDDGDFDKIEELKIL